MSTAKKKRDEINPTDSNGGMTAQPNRRIVEPQSPTSPTTDLGDGGGGWSPYDEASQSTNNGNSNNYLDSIAARDLFDANVMANITKEAAKKNMGLDLARMGLGNSGYAGTASAMIENAYNSALAENQRNYFNTVAEEEQSLASEKSASALSDLEIAYNYGDEAFNKFLEAYGLEFNNGQFSGEGYTDEMLNQLNLRYTFLNAMKDQNYDVSGVFKTPEELVNSGGDVTGQQVEWEVYQLFQDYPSGKGAENTVFKLQSGHDGSSIYVRYNYSKGGWERVNEAAYNDSKNKKNITASREAMDKAKGVVSGSTASEATTKSGSKLVGFLRK